MSLKIWKNILHRVSVTNEDSKNQPAKFLPTKDDALGNGSESSSPSGPNQSSAPHQETDKEKFFQACMSGNIDLMTSFYEQGMDVNILDDEERSPLLFACLAEQKSAVKMLLHWDAYVDNSDKSGRTALLWCAMSGKTSMLSLLLKAGADINFSDHQGKTPLHLSVNPNQTDTMTLLLERGCIVDPFDEKKTDTP
eukprot:Sdes_comp18919_c0_seq1m9379